MAWFKDRHLHRNFAITDILMLQEFEDASCVVASQRGYFGLNRAARRATFDASRAKIGALARALEEVVWMTCK